MIQKIIKVGNSAAVTIPREFLLKSDLEVGDKMIMESDFLNKILLIKPQAMSRKIYLSPEFFSWLSEISQKYEKTIKELARA